MNQLKMLNRAHVPLSDKDPDQKSRLELNLLIFPMLEKLDHKSGQFHDHGQRNQCDQLTPCAQRARFASVDAVGQTAARAKNRPDSGVTVIEVPKTAETCSEVIT